MSEQSARAFLMRAASDAAFEQQLGRAAGNSENKQSALMAFAKQEGFDFSLAELLTMAKAIQGELSDQSLESVAGGFGPKLESTKIQDGTSNTISRQGIIAILIGM